MSTQKISLWILTAFCTAMLAACTAPAAPVAPSPLPAVIEPSRTVPPSPLPPTPVPPTETPRPVPTSSGPALPPEPQVVKFQSSDGYELSGTYYPAAFMPAPLIVLMHWAGGNEADWVEIAFWLQNRGLGGKSPNPDGLPWLDSSWFPSLPSGSSYAVFTFSFRDCEAGGCKNFSRDKWLLDAQSAVMRAAQLEGIDPQLILTAGASIGADGAADGCSYLHSQRPLACRGAFSLSPGGYLTLPYAKAVSSLQSASPPVVARCLASKGDDISYDACKSAAGDAYRVVEYEGEEHGMALIQPGLKPSSLLEFLDFLKLAAAK